MITKILNLMLLVLLFTPTSRVFAAQDAVVREMKAVIYAEPEMITPIGFVTRGKKVRIGEVARNKGRVLPIIVSGKIAYIKIEDINILNEENLKRAKVLEKHRDEFYAQDDNIKRTNKVFNSLELAYSQVSPGSQWEEASEGVNGSKTADNGTSIKVAVKKEFKTPPLFWKPYFQQITISKDQLEASLLGGGVNFGMRFWASDTENWFFDASLGPKLFKGTQTVINEDISGYYAGAEFELELGYRLLKNIAVSVRTGYQVLQEFGFSNVSDTTAAGNDYLSTKKVPLDAISGTFLDVGLIWRY